MNLRFLYHYIQFFHNHIYYRKIEIKGKENIPDKNEATIIVANHQNAINDPLALEFAFPDRAVNLFAHGALFRNKIANSFFRSIHVIPAYRMRTDGEESLGKNYDEFASVEDKIFNGESVGIFPEATNQTSRFLGEFSLGYLRMAFAAAEKQNFEKDVKILPVGLHYDNYHRFHHSLLVNIAPPISLSPYYELYKTKPRTAQRQVNEAVRNALLSVMLDIPDAENYEAIDYLRNTYGIRYASLKGLDYRVLSQKLKADQEFTAKLAESADTDNEIYKKGLELKQKTLDAGLRDWIFTNKDSVGWLLCDALLLIFLLPLFLFFLIPNLIVFIAPYTLYGKFDRIGEKFTMYRGGINIILSSLITMPLAYIIAFIVDIFIFGILNAIIKLILSPWMLVFCWDYYNQVRKLISLIRSKLPSKKPIITEITDKRTQLWSELDNLLTKTL